MPHIISTHNWIHTIEHFVCSFLDGNGLLATAEWFQPVWYQLSSQGKLQLHRKQALPDTVSQSDVVLARVNKGGGECANTVCASNATSFVLDRVCYTASYASTRTVLLSTNACKMINKSDSNLVCLYLDDFSKLKNRIMLQWSTINVQHEGKGSSPPTVLLKFSLMWSARMVWGSTPPPSPPFISELAKTLRVHPWRHRWVYWQITVRFYSM